ncbi:MAG: hypothetical protein J5917_06480 [Bacteroidales bacterium]|nr:hypothetical protein [Bacteroidales bacterium]
MTKHLKHIVFWGGCLLMAAACSLIDEDMRDCEADTRIDYELRLVTNMTTELQTQLSQEADAEVAAALEACWKEIFSSRAHDVDLSFYDVAEPMERLHHERHVMDASQTSYTLYIPVRRYMHMAVANLEGSGNVRLEDDGQSTTASLRQQLADTLDSQTKGIFTARLPMDIREGVDQEFDVRLYMANSAAAIVLDTLGSHVKDVRVYGVGFATEFDLADSVYHFPYTPVIRSRKVEVGSVPGEPLCYTTVTFPSRASRESKADASGALWQLRVYSTMPDGKTAESVVHVTSPLEAGMVKIIKGKIYGNGALVPEEGDPSVSVSVVLDWTPGMEHEIEL